MMVGIFIDCKALQQLDDTSHPLYQVGEDFINASANERKNF
jgi:hypothetical protein